LEYNGSVLSENAFYFSRPKMQKLRKPEITIRITKEGQAFVLQLSAPMIVRDLVLQAPELPGVFDDNFIDLFPHRERRITFHAGEAYSLEEFKNRLTYLSLFELMEE
jgi:hypothetical protein